MGCRRSPPCLGIYCCIPFAISLKAHYGLQFLSSILFTKFYLYLFYVTWSSLIVWAFVANLERLQSQGLTCDSASFANRLHSFRILSALIYYVLWAHPKQILSTHSVKISDNITSPNVYKCLVTLSQRILADCTKITDNITSAKMRKHHIG